MVAPPLVDAGRLACCEAFSSFDSFAAFAASVHCPSFSDSGAEEPFLSECFELEPFPESFLASFLDHFSDAFSADPFLSESLESFELEPFPASRCASFLDDLSDSFSAGPCLSESLSLSESFFDEFEGSLWVEVVEAEVVVAEAVAVAVVACTVVEEVEVVACTVVEEVEVVACTVVELEEVAADVEAVVELVEDEDEVGTCAAAVSASAWALHRPVRASATNRTNRKALRTSQAARDPEVVIALLLTAADRSSAAAA